MTLAEIRAARHRLHPLLKPGGVLLVTAAIVGYVSAVDPNESGHYPICPFLYVTGYYCPGCGSLRMIHALGNGHLGEAFALNPLTFSLLPVLAFIWIRWTIALARGRPRGSARAKVADPRLVWGLLTAVLLFWIVRNLPFGAALAP